MSINRKRVRISSSSPAFIYTIWNTRNGKVYVGWTNDPKERWRKHRKNAKLGLTFYLYRALQKEPENFEFRVVAEHFSETEAMQAEKYWIAFFKSNDDRFGYNMTEGGEGCILRGSAHPNFGKSGPWLGKKQHENTRQALDKMLDERREKFQPIVEARLKQVQEEFENRRFGAISRLARMWNVSHTQVRKFIKQHIPTSFSG